MSLLDTASLIVTPNGYKEGTLYSVIPSDGSGDMSVVRATTATRVNSAGLVELVPYNLVEYSEQFDNSAWGKLNSTISANSTTAPNGTSTADKFIENNGTGQKWVYYAPTISSGVSYTYSVYAKKGERDFLYINAFSGSGSITWFNLNTGTIGTSQSGTPSIESVGNGWYRCSVTITSASGTQFHLLGVSNADNVADYSGNGTSGIYIWGAQLNEGTIKDYQKTETRLNIPRLDYSNGTCPSLLVEPQRTNLLTDSSAFGNWLNAGGSVTSNTTTAPDGTLTADTLTGLRYKQFFGPNVFSFSCYAKANGGSGNFWIRVDAPTTSQTVFDLTNGTYSAPSGYTASIEDAGNGWYRCTMTTPNITIVNAVVVSADYGANSTYLWGAQLEAGSYPTSYIPTTSASVTRNADVVSKTGISSLIGQTEGTLFLDVDFSETSDYNGWFLKEASTYDTFAFIQRETSGIIAVGYYGSGALQARIETAPSQPSGRYKIAFGYKNNDFVLYINGTQIGTDTSGSVTGLMDFYDIHFGATGTNLQNASALWKTRLTNTQLAQLTTI